MDPISSFLALCVTAVLVDVLGDRRDFRKFSSSYYHVTYTKNVPSILTYGLEPMSPQDAEDQEGIYLFKSVESAEDALMNWLGDRLDDENEPIALLEIDGTGVRPISGAADFEVISGSRILPQHIRVLDLNL